MIWSSLPQASALTRKLSRPDLKVLTRSPKASVSVYWEPLCWSRSASDTNVMAWCLRSCRGREIQTGGQIETHGYMTWKHTHICFNEETSEAVEDLLHLFPRVADGFGLQQVALSFYVKPLLHLQSWKKEKNTYIQGHEHGLKSNWSRSLSQFSKQQRVSWCFFFPLSLLLCVSLIDYAYV